MSKKNNKSKKPNNNKHNGESYKSPSSLRRAKFQKAVVWTLIAVVIVGLILSMAPSPTAFMDPNQFTVTG